MVTVIVGAVAVGLLSVCAIPLGCLISRRMNKAKVRDQRPAGSEYELEMEPLEAAGRRESRPGYEVEEFSSEERMQRFEVRVFISSGSVTGSVGIAGQREAPSQDAAAGPAAGRRVASAGSSSAPAIPNAANEDSITGSETTRLEITISGPPPRNAARFFEFREGLKDATSTPKKKRASWKPWNQPSKMSTTTRAVEVTELRSAASESELNSSERSLGTRAEPAPAAGPSAEGSGARARARGKWGFPYRFLETLRKTTDFATL